MIEKQKTALLALKQEVALPFKVSMMGMSKKFSTLFIGVDVHKESHTLVGVNAGCEKLFELKFENSFLGFEKALSRIKNEEEKRGFSSSLCGLEDTGSNGYAFAGYLSKKGIQVKTISPVLTANSRKRSTHPEKSDSRDAYEAAVVSVQRTDNLPDFILTEEYEFAKSLEALTGEYEELVNLRARIKNKLHFMLQKTYGIAYKEICQKTIFGKRALEFWIKYPSIVCFKKSTSSEWNKDKPEWLRKAKIENLPKSSEIERGYVKRLVMRLKIAGAQAKEVEKEIKKIVDEHYSYLPTLPGCGTITSARLTAYIKDIKRFKTEKQLAKYTGIAPRKCESGKTKRDIGSRRGHGGLRRAFKTIALAQIGRRGSQIAKTYFNRKVNEGKTKKQALKCLMRQNVKIVFKMMRDERSYY